MVSSDGHWLLTDGNGSAPAAASPDRDDQRHDGSQLWDLTGAEPKARLKTARGQTTDDKAATVVGFSHDGKRLVCGYRGGEIRVWSLDQPEVEATVKSFSGFNSAVAGFAVSRDGKTLAAGGEDGTVCLWALSTSAPATSKTAIGRIDAPADRLAFSPDGRTIAAASTTIERRGAARELKSADATKHLAEALPPQKVRLWTIQPDGTAASLTTLKETVGGIQQLSFNEAGTRLIALVQQPKPAPGQSPYVTQMALEWNIDPAGPTVPVAVDEQGNFGRSELSSDGRWLVAGGYPTDEPTNVLRGDPATARLWDLQVMASRKASVLFGFGDEVIDDMPEFVFSLDGRGLAAVSNNRPILADDLNDHERVVRVYDLGRGDIRSPEAIVLRLRGPAITQAAVNSDGRRLITMSADHTVRIWDLDDEHLISFARRTAGRELTDEERSMYLLDSP
jgi:WD40 repeat protein